MTTPTITDATIEAACDLLRAAMQAQRDGRCLAFFSLSGHVDAIEVNVYPTDPENRPEHETWRGPALLTGGVYVDNERASAKLVRLAAAIRAPGALEHIAEALASSGDADPAPAPEAA